MVPWCNSNKDVVAEFCSSGMAVFVPDKPEFIYNDVSRLIHYGQFFFNFYVCNAMNFNQMIATLEKYNRKYLWWIHEGEVLHNNWITPEIQRDFVASRFLYAVSEFARQPLLKYNSNVNILPLGISDSLEDYNGNTNLHSPLYFIVPGPVCHLKGQDIAVEAYKRLGAEYQARCEIIFVGDSSSDYAREVMSSSIDFPGLKFLGSVSRSNVLELLSHSVAMLLTSRSESFSIVAVEGLMFDKPIIISDQMGVSPYVENGINGFVFDINNIHELDEYMKRIIHNPHILEKGKARELYERTFSQECFQENVKSIMEKIGL